MSWLDTIDLPLTIRTGNGSEFSVLWKPLSKALEWNVAEFNFNNIDGGLVNRRRLKARKFPIRFWFQGEDHLDNAQAFENSSKDTRPWTISHPLYGNLLVQPTALEFNNENYGITEITGTVIETLTDDLPVFSPDPVYKITNDKAALDEVLIAAYDDTPTTEDVTEMLEENNNFFLKALKLLKKAADLINKFKAAQRAALNAISKVNTAIRTAQALINAPAMFVNGIKERTGLIKDQFGGLRSKVGKLTGRSGKKMYESRGSSFVSTMCLASAYPSPGDYSNRPAVLEVAASVIEMYNNYVTDIDSLQSANGGSPDSYIPDFESLNRLKDLVDFTVSNLFTISQGAKQQRTVVLENDSNWILLAHRFYGLKADDSTIQELIDNNQAGLNEMLVVKKGRRVVYYV
jgi:hypothetical protein